MADNLRKYTTQEVLNKVYTDSSGITIGLNSQTSKETLNAVLDSSNNRLQVAMAGGTISGDVTISGDLTVEGSSSNGNFDEIVQGGLKVQSDANDFIIVAQDAGGGNLGGFYRNSGGDVQLYGFNSSHAEKFVINSNGDTHFSGGQVGIGVTSPDYELDIQSDGDTEARIKAITSTGRARLRLDGNSDLAEIYFGVSGNLRSAIYQSTSSPYTLNVYSFAGTGNVATFDTTNMRLGIGADAPTKDLDILNSDGATIRIRGDADTDTNTIEFGTSVAQYHKIISNSNTGQLQIGSFSGSGHSVRLVADNQTKMIIDVNSNISLSNNDSGNNNTVFGKGSGLDLASGAAFNVFYGEDAGANNTTSNENTAIGYRALFYNVVGANNTAIGNIAMRGVSGQSGSYNTAIGSGSLQAITTGSNNTAVGIYSGYQLTDGTKNTLIGGSAGERLTTNTNFNVFVGYQSGEYADGTTVASVNNTYIGTFAGRFLDDGQNNVAIGYGAMTSNSDGAGNNANACIAIGRNAMAGSETNVGTIAIGHFAGDNGSADIDNAVIIGREAGRDALTSGADGAVGVGYKSLFSLTSGARNTAIGYESTLNNVSGSDGTFLGYQSGLNVLLNFNTGIGAYTLQKIGTTGGGGAGENNTALGALAMSGGDDTVANNTAKNNVAIGYASLGGATKSSDGAAFTTHSSTAVGYEALTNLASGNSNLAIGYQSSKALTGGAANITIGHQAMLNATLISSAVFIGANAGDAITTSTDPNGTIGIGYDALTSLTVGIGNLAIGYNAMKEHVDGDYNTVLGHNAMSDSNNHNGAHNVFIGSQSGAGGWSGAASSNTALGSFSFGGGAKTADAVDNVAVGRDSLYAVTSGARNVSIGKSAGSALTTGSNNVLMGHQAGDAITTDQNVVAIGRDAYSAQDTSNDAEGSSGHGSGNIAIGYQSMQTFNQVNCLRNTAIGFQTMSAGSTHDPQDSVAIGYRALQMINDGDKNTAVGSYSGKNIITGVRNTAIGASALLDNQSASDNTAVGELALENTTGAENTAIGRMAGNTNTSGINNVFVGKAADTTGSSFAYQTALGWNAVTSGTYEVAIGMNGIKKFKTARITLNSFSSGNNTSGKIYSNGALFTIPAYSFVKRVVAKIVTLSSNGDALLAIGSSATTDSAIGDSISSATYYIRHSSLGTGYSSRSQASTGTEVAINVGDNANANSVVGMTFIGAIDDNNAGGWLSAEHAFYVVHAGGNTNSAPTTPPVIDVLVEYY